jgi:hypothetical protein
VIKERKIREEKENRRRSRGNVTKDYEERKRKKQNFRKSSQ